MERHLQVAAVEVAHKALLVRKASKESQELKGSQVLKELLAPKVLKALLVPEYKAFKDAKAPLEHRAS
jgi:hypothetical protein